MSFVLYPENFVASFTITNPLTVVPTGACEAPVKHAEWRNLYIHKKAVRISPLHTFRWRSICFGRNDGVGEIRWRSMCFGRNDGVGNTIVIWVFVFENDWELGMTIQGNRF